MLIDITLTGAAGRNSCSVLVVSGRSVLKRSKVKKSQPENPDLIHSLACGKQEPESVGCIDGMWCVPPVQPRAGPAPGCLGA